ncbi:MULTISPECIES: type II toxin-antitoxin system PemK/MazF family toxin [Pseudanabaena]|jgi:mRNA interferase MazF|uniref:type II toxin-antitoxin system PemK/MazF family toxin n=1 Tax=Pseudanabaena TaxID=1152 RepID=UPI002479B499|nr:MULTISPECIES: type II toxin-antitoxin system PemK/MazF family toxin [Pseudanabaena]MEA5489381.1 type II toxin-antitoxin system PemK/MazF family toxin [Pseudanabaena sp. CCNP1317]WGS72791.1 type II toxin-antitoxin system PemK/MazF family toxin [Pseudanabaena galeata CCNP1313]
MPPKNIKRGDVVLVVFPNSNLTTAKTRPAIIVQADNLQTGLPQIVVAMITSRMIRSIHPSRVLVMLNTIAGKQSGLLTDSVVMTDNLTTITTSAIHNVIGSLPTTEIDQALRHTLGI